MEVEMSYTFKNAAGSTVYAEADGAGTSGDPYVPRVGGNAATESATLTFSASGTAQTVSFAWPQWASSAVMLIINGGDQAVSVGIRPRTTETFSVYEGSSDIAASGFKSYGPNSAGAGATSYVQVGALGQSWYGTDLRARIEPAASMSGDVDITVIWSS
jgi:hypothetical protein